MSTAILLILSARRAAQLVALLSVIRNLEPAIIVAMYWHKAIENALIVKSLFDFSHDGTLQTRPSFSINSRALSGPQVPTGY